jgi:N-acyl homoserine lactone hydrolase
MPKSKAKGTD